MSLTIVEVAPDTMLTTLARVKTALGITDSSKDDELTFMIKSASDFAVRYCGRDFALQKVREGVIGKGTSEILLSLTPLVDIDSLYYNDDLVPSDSYRIADAEVGTVQSDLGFKGSYYANPDFFHDFPSTTGKEVYFFTYDGGYVLPNWGESHGNRTLPYDIERAIVDTVKQAFRGGSAAGIAWDGVMSSYRIGDTQVSWGNKTSAQSSQQDGGASAYFPPSALAVLNWYRRAY